MKKRRLQHSVVALGVVSGSLLGATHGVPPASAQAPKEAPSTPVTWTERFEGYVWLDADGCPLPFQSDEAIEAWETCLEHEPDFAHAYNNLAVVYWKMNRFDEARASVRKVEELGLQVNPEFKAELQRSISNQQQVGD